MVRYAITDRRLFSGDERDRCEALAAQARRLAREGVSVLQVREKDLPERELEALTRCIVSAAHDSRRPESTNLPATRVLLNGPAHLAAAAGAAGVHLRGGAGADDLDRVRTVFAAAGLARPVVSLSCHSVEEARAAALAGFDYLLFGPVFEKRVRGDLLAPGLGLDALRRAAQQTGGACLLALGGVTRENAPDCLRAGAAGIAGIRLFLESSSPVVVKG